MSNRIVWVQSSWVQASVILDNWSVVNLVRDEWEKKHVQNIELKWQKTINFLRAFFNPLSERWEKVTWNVFATVDKRPLSTYVYKRLWWVAWIFKKSWDKKLWDKLFTVTESFSLESIRDSILNVIQKVDSFYQSEKWKRYLKQKESMLKTSPSREWLNFEKYEIPYSMFVWNNKQVLIQICKEIDEITKRWDKNWNVVFFRSNKTNFLKDWDKDVIDDNRQKVWVQYTFKVYVDWESEETPKVQEEKFEWNIVEILETIFSNLEGNKALSQKIEWQLKELEWDENWNVFIEKDDNDEIIDIKFEIIS